MKTRPAAAKAVDPTRILVRDVMQTDVLVLHPDDPVRTAAEQLEDVGASGAPVVDAAGKPVGVLTLADIARGEHVSDDGVAARPTPRPTDALDAPVIALFAKAVRPVARPVPDEQARVLGELVARRRQLVDMLCAEQNRRRLLSDRGLQRHLDAHIA